MIKYKLLQEQHASSAVVHHAKLWKFPGGEVGAALLPVGYINVTGIVITAWVRNSDDFMQLCMFLDAATRTHSAAKIHLHIPYLPYARQDRVCNEGESLSIAVIARIINSYNLTRVYLYDVHSDVSLALFNSVVHITQADTFIGKLVELQTEVLIAPDAGAAKKIYESASRMSHSVEVVIANKKRNVQTGEIISVDVDVEKIRGKRCVVLDDICDGGRTFIELSGYVKNVAKELTLCVTHGIFSKGEDVVCDAYGRVITTDSFATPDQFKRVEIIRTKYM